MSRHAFDVVVIGAGSAGMTAAEVAAKMGVRCAVVERDRVGGDCLWTGCVPSKALIASARAAHQIRRADAYGLRLSDSAIDPSGVWARLRRIQQEIAAADDNAERFAGMGVEMVRGPARLVDGHTVEVGARRLTTRFVLLASGSRPAVPPIEGLADAGYLTSEDLFAQERLPASMLIVGGGPIAIEMAQAHQRLGVRTTVLELADRILQAEERALAGQVLTLLRMEGVDVQTEAKIAAAERTAEGALLRGAVGREERTWRAEQVLIATGRRPNVDGLGLADAGVATSSAGVRVDAELRTSVPSVYACGDVAGRYLFTHSAGAEAATALRNMFYPGSKPAPSLVPWAIFTDPELAHAGMTSDEARAALGERKTRVFRWSLAHNDRARADGQQAGEVVVVTDAKFRIVGAHILAPHASEMIGELALAIDRRLRLTPDIANLIHVYPTIATSLSQVAAQATYGQLERPFLRAVRRIYGRLR